MRRMLLKLCKKAILAGSRFGAYSQSAITLADTNCPNRDPYETNRISDLLIADQVGKISHAGRMLRNASISVSVLNGFAT